MAERIYTIKSGLKPEPMAAPAQPATVGAAGSVGDVASYNANTAGVPTATVAEVASAGQTAGRVYRKKSSLTAAAGNVTASASQRTYTPKLSVRVEQAKNLQGMWDWLDEANTIIQSTIEYTKANEGKWVSGYASEYTDKVQKLLQSYSTYAPYIEFYKGEEAYSSLDQAFKEFKSYLGEFDAYATALREQYDQYPDEAAYNKAVEDQKKWQEDAAQLEQDVEMLAGQIQYTQDLIDLITAYEVEMSENGDVKLGKTGDGLNGGKLYDLEKKMDYYGVPYQDMQERDKFKKSLEKKLAGYKEEYTPAKQQQVANAANTAKADPDYETYVADGKHQYENRYENYKTISSVADERTKNKVKKWFDEVENYDELWSHLTDDQKETYYYLLGKYGHEDASVYFKLSRNKLKEDAAEAYYNEELKGKWYEGLYAAISGFDRFSTGMKVAFGNDAADDRLVDPQFIKSEVYDALGEKETAIWYNFKEHKWETTIAGKTASQVGYDVLDNTTNMLPSMLAGLAAGAINPALGTAVQMSLTGLSTGGNAYKEAIDRGYEHHEAMNYAFLVGTSEATLQKLLSGTGTVVGGSVVGNAITNATGGIKSAALTIALNVGGSIASEALEEGLQEVLVPFFENMALDADNTWADIDWEQAGYAAFLGGLTAFGMKGAVASASIPMRYARQTAAYRKLGKTFLKGEEFESPDGEKMRATIDRAIEIGMDNAKGTDARIAAEKISEKVKAGKKVSAYAVGRMVAESQTEQAQVSKAIEREVVESGRKVGYDAEAVDTVARAAVALNQRVRFATQGELQNPNNAAEYHPETDMVLLNPVLTDTNLLIGQMLAHEMTHAAEGTAQLQKLERIAQRMEGDKWDSLKAEIKSEYAKVGKQLSDTEVQKEALANWIGEKLFTDKAFAKAVADGDANVGNAFFYLIDRLRRAMGAKKASAGNLAMLERLFMQALDNRTLGPRDGDAQTAPFRVDVSAYPERMQDTMRRAMESGVLNNSAATHQFVEWVAKITADTGVPFSFTNNAKLRASGFAIDGKHINGLTTSEGVLLNAESTKAYQAVVGHEIVHVLEGNTVFYQQLQSAARAYAEAKGEYQLKRSQIIETYAGMDVDVDAELTADLVGEYLFTDAAFLGKLSVEHKSLFRRLFDEVKYMLSVATAGSTEARALAKLQKSFEVLYRGGGKVSSRDSGLQMQNAVEETNDLLALHNLTAAEMQEMLHRGGVVMPSVAVTNGEFSKFGEISFVLEKGTIDPATDSQNKLWGNDAWTPQRKGIKKNPVFDEAKTEKIVRDLKKTVSDAGAAYLLDMSAQQFEQAIINADGSVVDAFAYDVGVRTAYALQEGILTNVPTDETGSVDLAELDAQLVAKLHTHEGWRKWRQWLNGISGEIITKFDTPTNEDILNNMQAQPATTKKFRLTENGELTVPAVEYRTIEELRQNKGRLSADAVAETKKVAGTMLQWAEHIAQRSGVTPSAVVASINAAFDSKYDVAGIAEAFRKSGIYLNLDEATELQSLYQSALELPAEYFEAKPGGFVSLDQVAVAVVPHNLDPEIKRAMAERNIQMAEYDPAVEGDRLRVVQQFEAYKFSIDAEIEAENLYTDLSISNLDTATSATSNTTQGALLPSEYRPGARAEGVDPNTNVEGDTDAADARTPSVADGDTSFREGGFETVEVDEAAVLESAVRSQVQGKQRVAVDTSSTEGIKDVNPYLDKLVAELGPQEVLRRMYNATRMDRPTGMVEIDGKRVDAAAYMDAYEQSLPKDKAALERHIERLQEQRTEEMVKLEQEEALEDYRFGGLKIDLQLFAATRLWDLLQLDEGENGTDVRQFYEKRLRGTDAIHNQELIDMLATNEETYNPIANKKTLEKANSFLRDSQKQEKLLKRIGRYNPRDMFNAVEMAAAQVLIKDAINDGEIGVAADLITGLSRKGTEAGRAVQALSMMARLTPEGTLKAAIKTVKAEADYAICEGANEGLDVLADDIARAIKEAEGKGLTSDEIAERIRNGESTRGVEDAAPYAVNSSTEIHNMLEKIRGGDFMQDDKVEFGKVPDAIIQRLREVTGTDVTGYKMVIEARILDHILKDHGIKGLANHSMKNDADIARMGDTLANPDDIRKGDPTEAYTHHRDGRKKPSPTVIYEKGEGDQSYYVIHTIANTKKKTLYVATAFIGEPGYKKGAQQATDGISPGATSEIEVAGTPTDIIARGEGQVKADVKMSREELTQLLSEDLAGEKGNFFAQEEVYDLLWKTVEDCTNIPEQLKRYVLKKIRKDDGGLAQRIYELHKRGDLKQTKLRRAMEEALELPTLTDEDLSWIVKQGAKIESLQDKPVEQADAMEELYDYLGAKLTVTGLDAWQSWRKFGMLFNVKTHLRNIFSNAAYAGIRKADDAVAMVLERVFVRDPNQRGAALGWRYTKHGKNILPQLQERAELAVLEMKKRGAKYEQGVGMLKQKRKYFGESKVGEALNNANRWNSDMLEAEDVWFFRPAYIDALGQIMTARKATEITEDMHQIAMQRALEATFRADNAISDVISSLKRFQNESATGKRLFGHGVDVVIPFHKTPANIATQTVMHSPVGIVKGAFDLYNAVHGKGSKDAATAINTMAKGVTGTALLIIGMLLGHAGLFNTGFGKTEKERAADEMAGLQEGSFVIGGVSISLDWLQPAASPLIVGASIAERMNGDGFTIGDFFGAVMDGTDSLFEMTMLQSLYDILGGYDAGASGTLMSVGENLISQSVPTVVGQVARAIDPVQRKTKGDSDFETIVNQVMAKIPGLTYLLDPELDVWGNEVYRTGKPGTGTTVLNALQQVLIPANTKVGTGKGDPISEEILRLYATQGGAVIPTAITRDEAAEMEEDYVDVNRLLGGTNRLAVEEFVGNKKAYDVQVETGELTEKGNPRTKKVTKYYRDMTDDERRKVLSRIYKATKAELTGDTEGKTESQLTDNERYIRELLARVRSGERGTFDGATVPTSAPAQQQPEQPKQEDTSYYEDLLRRMKNGY